MRTEKKYHGYTLLGKPPKAQEVFGEFSSMTFFWGCRCDHNKIKHIFHVTDPARDEKASHLVICLIKNQLIQVEKEMDLQPRMNGNKQPLKPLNK